MWYICRKPCNSSPENHLNFSRTTIFPISDLGDLDDISFVITNDDDNDNDNNDQRQQTLQNFVNNNQWQWFTYESNPLQFIGAAVPRDTQIIFVRAHNNFLCARMVYSSLNESSRSKRGKCAKLCTYSRENDDLVDVPSRMETELGFVRDLLSASCAILNGWLYVAGGYSALSSSDTQEKPSTTPLESAERFNLTALQWETLPKMLKPRAYATGIANRGMFYCIGGENYEHSAQVYNPKQNSWFLVERFIPEEANGFCVGSVGGKMILLTWSTVLGVKLWRYSGGPMSRQWTLVMFYADNKVARSWLDHKGPKLVRIHRQLFIMTGVDDDFCWVDGLNVWPVLPAPSFHVCDEVKLSQSGLIHAVRFTRPTFAPSWRYYPAYRVENGH